MQSNKTLNEKRAKFEKFRAYIDLAGDSATRVHLRHPPGLRELHLQQCYKNVTKCYKNVTKALQQCYNSTPYVSQYQRIISLGGELPPLNEQLSCACLDVALIVCRQKRIGSTKAMQ